MSEISVTIGSVQPEVKAPKKWSEIIKNTRLLETTGEIETAVKKLKTDKTIKPRDFVEISKVIEKGEKKIAKEYAKRLAEQQEIINELEYLIEFADKMGYTLKDTEEVETEEAAGAGE